MQPVMLELDSVGFGNASAVVGFYKASLVLRKPAVCQDLNVITRFSVWSILPHCCSFALFAYVVVRVTIPFQPVEHFTFSVIVQKPFLYGAQ